MTAPIAPPADAGPAGVPGDRFWRVRHLVPLLVVTGGLLVAAALLGGATAGWPGAFGGAAGVAVVTGSYTLSTVVIAWADAAAPALLLPLALTTYAVKFTGIGLLMMWLVSRDWAGLPAMGLGVLAGVVGWTATQIWWVVRTQRAAG